MKSRVPIFLAVLVALIGLAAEPPSPSLVDSQIETLIATLNLMIIPPKGTARSEVDAVYGQPTEEKDLRGKGSATMYPMHVYALLPAAKGQEFRAFLYVTYKDGVIRFTGINHYAVVQNRDFQPHADEVAKENRRVLVDLLEIQEKYIEQLPKASWNRKTSEQGAAPLPPALQAGHSEGAR